MAHSKWCLAAVAAIWVLPITPALGQVPVQKRPPDYETAKKLKTWQTQQSGQSQTRPGSTTSDLIPAAIIAVVSVGCAAGIWMLYRRRRSAGRSAEPPAQPPPPPPRSVFVSYRRGDSADIAGRITDRLFEKFGRGQVFKDVDSIPLGADFRRHIQNAVSQCGVLLAVIGRDWSEIRDESGARRLDNADDFVRLEIEAALDRNIPVIPILVQGAKMPVPESLPESLRGLAFRNGLAVRPDPDFNNDMERLIHGIEAGFTARVAV